MLCFSITNRQLIKKGEAFVSPVFLGGYVVELFLDESGSMTREYCDDFPYFVICMVKVKDKKKLKKSYKYFIKKNFDKLKSIDKNNKMFKNTKYSFAFGCEPRGGAG